MSRLSTVCRHGWHRASHWCCLRSLVKLGRPHIQRIDEMKTRLRVRVIGVLAVGAIVLALASCTAAVNGSIPNTGSRDPDPPKRPATIVCVDGAPSVDDPTLCERGEFPINGIDKIPLNLVKLTNKEMQELFVHVDIREEHIRATGETVCGSYITKSLACELRVNRTRVDRKDGSVTSGSGSVPFSELMDFDHGDNARMYSEWLWPTLQEMKGVRVASHPLHPNSAPYFVGDGSYSYLIVAAAGNEGVDSIFDTRPLLRDRFESDVLRAARDHKLLFVAGYRYDNGTYVRDTSSSGCKDLDGCIWAPFSLPSGGGTSNATPHLAAALASVLAVFPDTSYRNLAKFAKACAKKRGNGIEQLRRQSGGIGVADFFCMGVVTDALENLPAGGAADVAVDGRTVTVSERELIVHGP